MMSRPLYRIAAAGLDPRDARLIEIVFRHSQYNRFEFRLVPVESFDAVDILIVNTVETEGLRALARMRTLGRDVPVIAAVPRGAPSSARHAISIDRLTLQLLPILNRVVEAELSDPDTRPMMPSDEHVRVPEPDLVEAAAAAAGFEATMPVALEPASSEPPRPSPPVATATRPPTPASHEPLPPEPREPPPRSTPAAGMPIPPRRAASGLPGPAVEPPAESTDEMPPFRRRVPPPEAPVAPANEPSANKPVARKAAPGPAPAALPTPPITPTEDLPAPGSRVRILVVDDSPTVRKQLSIALDRMGVVCDTAENAVGGLTRMQDVRYDLIMVDVVMPEIDGYQLTREIRRRHRGVPVIILTSRSSPFDLARGALAGCASYLVKPVTLRKLEAAVVKVLRKTLAIDDLTGLLRPISMYSPAGSGAKAPERTGTPGSTG